MNKFKVGGFAENLVRSILDKAQIPNVKNPAKTREGMTGWDIQATVEGQVFTLEVKFDRMASKTGNLAVEYYNTKSCRDSGINATTADLWVVVLDNPAAVWVTKVEKLKSFFTTAKCLREIASGGDDNSAMKLYRKEDILRIFTRVDNLNDSQLRQVLGEMLK